MSNTYTTANSTSLDANDLLILPMVKLKADMHEAATMLTMPFKEYIVENAAGTRRWYEGRHGWNVLFTYSFHPKTIAYVTSQEGAPPRYPWSLRVVFNSMTINETRGEGQIDMTDEQLVIELARLVELSEGWRWGNLHRPSVHPSLKQSFNQPEKANEL